MENQQEDPEITSLRRLINQEKVNLQSKFRLKVEKMWYNREISEQLRDDLFTMIGEAFHS